MALEKLRESTAGATLVCRPQCANEEGGQAGSNPWAVSIQKNKRVGQLGKQR